MSIKILNNISESDFSYFADSIGMIICCCDDDLTMLAINDEALKLFCYTREEIATIAENKAAYLIHPNDRSKIVALTQRRRGNEDLSFGITTRIKTKTDNKDKYVSVDGTIMERNGERLIVFSVRKSSTKLHSAAELGNMKDFIYKVTNLTEDSFFEYSINEDTMVFSKMFADRFGLPEVIENFANIVRNTDIVCKDSRRDISSRQLVSVSKRTVSKKVHLRDNSGREYWYMLYYRVFGDDKGRPAKVVGKMNDITTEQGEIEKLTKLSETDLLTGLYNKVSVEHFIKESLREDRRNANEFHALLIVDIDNFKTVNDTLGHLFGDALLAQLADKLRGIFRSDDIIGRIGGDEFFVFLKKCVNDKVIASKAQEICSAFDMTFNEAEHPITISSSIGIAKASEHGMSFEQLYKFADVALYHVKATTKNGFAFYDESMGKAPYVSQRTELDSDIQGRKNFNRNRTEFFFNMLYNSDDLATIFPSVIKLVAEQYGYSKGYFFEREGQSDLFKKTFSWDDISNLSGHDILNEVTAEHFSASIECLLDKGHMVISDIDLHEADIERIALKESGVKALIIYPIMSRGEFTGFFAMEDSLKVHHVSSIEVDEIGTISSVLITFLLKYRLEQRLLNNK